MGFVDDILKKLFSGESASKRSKPVLQVESIQRSVQFNALYDEWLTGSHAKALLDHLLEQYHLIIHEDQDSEDLVVMNRQGANGFICYGLDNEQVYYLIDYLKEKIKGFGYTQFNGDRNIQEQKDHFKITERYYLKPQLTNEDFIGKRKQLYGNILIEVEAKDDEPKHLKLLSTTYTDRNYETAYPFDQLVNELFSV